MIGTTVGKYRIVGQLGRGGMGIVYKAIDDTLDREVAIKVLDPALGDPEVMRRFRAEAVILAKLNHPGIARIYELARSNDDVVMVMELVGGESLDKLSARVGALPPERAAYIIDRVLGALEYAHRAGIVHRDLKPGNVMVIEQGGVKVMDFGIARVRGTAHMTVAGNMVGTPAYMAPEQVLGHEVDGRADLYSVGVVLYRLLTGALPFKADTAIAMARKQVSEEPTPLRLHQPDLPDWCETILRRALAKSPADRFQTAEEFRTALAHAVPHAADDVEVTCIGEFEITTPPRPVAVETLAATPFGSARTSGLDRRDDSDGSRGTAQALPDRPAGPVTPTPSVAAAMPAPVSTSGDGAIVLRTKSLVLAAALLAVLAASVVVLAVVALRGPAARPSSEPAPAQAAQSPVSAPPRTAPSPGPTPPTGGTSTTEPLVPSPAKSAGETSAAAPAKPPATSGAREKPSQPAATPAPATAAGGGSSAGVLASRPMAAAAGSRPVVFEAKMLNDAGAERKEYGTRVVVGDGRVTLYGADGHDLIQAAPYETIMSISYSKGREPLWNSPGGPAPVIRVEGGAFGFFRGDSYWISLRTKERFIVLRLDGGQVEGVLAALEEHTGRTVERVTGPRDPR